MPPLNIPNAFFFTTENFPRPILNLAYRTYSMYYIYMPDVKVYVRTEDLDKWNAIEKKSQWLSVCLNTINPKGTAEFKMNLKPDLVLDSKTKAIDPVDIPKVIKTPQDAKKVIESKGWSGSIPKSYSARKKK